MLEPDREASFVADMVEIQLGHMCNNRCVFCSSGQATALGQARPMDAEPIFAALDRAKARRARKVTFLGGEPTLQRAFLPALARAQRLGFEEIEIFTNGVKAARHTWVDEVVALGTFTWRFSIQGGNEAAHDAATVKPGAWKRITAGMDNVRAHGQRITANACINELSYRSLPDYVDVVRRYGVAQLHLDVVRPASSGERSDAYLDEIIPRHEDMAPYFDEMLARFDAWDPDFDVNVGNFPYCLLPQWAHKIHHGGQPTLTLASQGDNSLYAKDKYEFQHSDKHHAPACARCVFRPECSGVFEAYGRVNGTDELRPVSVQRLRELDPTQRAFVAQVEPDVAAVRALGLCDAWGVGDVFRSSRDRIVEVALTWQGAPALRLRWLPAATDEASLMRTGRYALQLRRDGDPPAAALPALARRLRELVASDPSVEVTHLADDAVWVATAMDPKRLARARALITAGVRRLEAIADWPEGVSLRGHRPDPDWPGTILEVGDATRTIAFGLRARADGPSLVEVTVPTRAGVSPQLVRVCAGRLRAGLGGSSG